MKVVLSPNPYRDRGLRAAQYAKRVLDRGGVDTVVCLPFEVDSGSHLELPVDLALGRLAQELEGADVLVCFGGDGTILHSAREATARNIPVLGVNLGSIGFMAELEQGELSLLSRLVNGKFGVERRMMLDITVRRDGRTVFTESALNDAVVTKGAVARVLDLEVTGDRVVISSFSGDGLIAATPTGSTAYSMAAGGPFVLDSARAVGIRVAPGCKKTAYLSVDGGRAFRIQPGDWVECRRSKQVTRLVKLTGRSFYERINQKLGKA